MRFRLNYSLGISSRPTDFESRMTVFTTFLGRKIWIVTCIIFFQLAPVLVIAQSLDGIVKASDNALLESANIKNLRSGAHAHTNDRGTFLLKEATFGDSIQVSHLGYRSVRLVYEGKKVIVTLEPSGVQLKDVIIQSSVSHLNVVSMIDLKVNPVSSSQELLRKVPGLFIGQHAGGGKAEQLFLRGFDIDHGTDINLSIDGMPVNMVSHAHGQGYSDLHFLIPETVEKIDFDKGPYHAEKGNMATAGYAAFTTKERLTHSSVTFEAGKFNTVKTLLLLNLLNTEKQTGYIASEYRATNGPFVASQNFSRLNLFGKYTLNLENEDKLTVIASHFNSGWDASGQIPDRAVKSGIIGRFGAIDSTEGGNTSRKNLNFNYRKKLNDRSYIATTAFLSRYNFELYSNFTFFLNDPIYGDQIRQKENRTLSGFQSEFNQELLSGKMMLKGGIGLRNDAINNIELSHTVNRKNTLQNVKLGDINETNFYGYVDPELKLGKWLINSALRFDYLNFRYNDKLADAYSNTSNSQIIVSPKLNFLYEQNQQLQFFLKLGKGFHSNDSRVVISERDKKTLPAAYGGDLGLTWKPSSNLYINTAWWYLFLEQEFVYVGDEGVVEPGGRTVRNGFDFGLRYQLNDWLFINSDLTFTRGRSRDDPSNANYIPLAPRFTYMGGLTVQNRTGFSGGIKSRFLGDRPANEDYSIVAKGYIVTDLNSSYSWKHFNLGLAVENIFNVKWNETQFNTESRLKNEPISIEEIHFTPGIPLNFRGSISYKF